MRAKLETAITVATDNYDGTRSQTHTKVKLGTFSPRCPKLIAKAVQDHERFAAMTGHVEVLAGVGGTADGYGSRVGGQIHSQNITLKKKKNVVHASTICSYQGDCNKRYFKLWKRNEKMKKMCKNVTKNI